MKRIAMFALWILFLTGCKSTPKAKIYSLQDVTNELQEGSVQLGSTEEVVRAFFKTHPAYRICKDYPGQFLISVVRNTQSDPKSDDQYISVHYGDGKVDQMDVGPPQFSVGNLPGQCRFR